MATYIVTYDLNNETVRPPIVNAIKKLGPWARLSESSYGVVSSSTPEAIYDVLKKHLDSDDQLYVITLNHPYFGQGSKVVNDWLEKHL